MIPPSVFRVFRAAKYHRLYLQTFLMEKLALFPMNENNFMKHKLLGAIFSLKRTLSIIATF